MTSRQAIIDDLVDEFRYGGDGSLWRQAVLGWAKKRQGPVTATAAVVALYWVGKFVPVPGLSESSMAQLRYSADNSSGLFALWDLVSGGNLSRAAIFAFGVVPYINGSVLVHVAITIWKALTRRASTPSARRIVTATRITAVVLCLMWSRALALRFDPSAGSVFADSWSWWFQAVAMTTLTAGTTLLMAVSDYITKRGIANGMVVVFIAAILTELPNVGRGLRAEPLPALLTLTIVVTGVAWTARPYRAALTDAFEMSDSISTLQPAE